MIDFEKTTIAWLNAGELDAHAASKVPANLDQPFVRVTLLDGRQDPTIPALSHAIGFIQVDAYAGAGGQAEAMALATKVMARLQAMPGSHAGGVVSAVNGIGCSNVPDTEIRPARDRYIVTAQVYAHG